jgi:hypothetical protein
MNVHDAATILDINDNLGRRWSDAELIWFEHHAQNMEIMYGEEFPMLVARAEGFVDGYREGGKAYVQ